jgi:ribosomal protein S4
MAKRLSKRDGSFEVNFILALEGRLINAVYRTGLVANIFECMEIVNDGHFLINQARLGHLNHSVRLTDLLAFSAEYK